MHQTSATSKTGVIFCPRDLHTFDGWQIPFDGALGLCVNEDDPDNVRILIPEPTTGIVHSYEPMYGHEMATYPTSLIGARDIQYVNSIYYVSNTAQINAYDNTWTLITSYILPQDAHGNGFLTVSPWTEELATWSSYLVAFTVLSDGSILYQRDDDTCITVQDTGITYGAIPGHYYGVFSADGSTHTFLTATTIDPSTGATLTTPFAFEPNMTTTAVTPVVFPGGSPEYVGVGVPGSNPMYFFYTPVINDTLYPRAMPSMSQYPYILNGAFYASPGNGLPATLWLLEPGMVLPAQNDWGAVVNEHGERYDASGQCTYPTGYLPFWRVVNDKMPHITQYPGEAYSIKQSIFEPTLTGAGFPLSTIGGYSVQAYLPWLGAPFSYGIHYDVSTGSPIQAYWYDINGWRAYQYQSAQILNGTGACWGRIAWSVVNQSVYGILVAGAPSFWNTPAPGPGPGPTPGPNPNAGGNANAISTIVDSTNFIHITYIYNNNVYYTRRGADEANSANIPPVMLNTDDTFVPVNISISCDKYDVITVYWEEVNNNGLERSTTSIDGGTAWVLQPV